MSELLRVMFKEWRYDQRLTLREVESMTGLSNAFLSQFERGNAKSISLDNAVKLLCCLMIKGDQ